jgi:hypothetical protein
MNKYINEAITSKRPFTVIYFKDGKYQGLMVINPITIINYD